jgi:hypothetical protein
MDFLEIKRIVKWSISMMKIKKDAFLNVLEYNAYVQKKIALWKNLKKTILIENQNYQEEEEQEEPIKEIEFL